METYSRPPLRSSKRTPEQILDPQDMNLLIRHFKDFLDRKGKGFDKKSQLSEGERSLATTLYSMLREEHGFYPDHIGSNDRIVWGVALKSDLQMLMEKEGKKYEERGLEVSSNKGELGRLMEGRRIKE
jgi:hypothetical protein